MKKKIKIKQGTGASGTPAGSRAGSPIPPSKFPDSTGMYANQSRLTSVPDTQGLSPTKTGTSTPRGSPPPPAQAPARPVAPIEVSEIVQVISEHKDGISLANMLRKFADRVNKPGGTTRADFFLMVRTNAEYGADKLLRPKKA